MNQEIKATTVLCVKKGNQIAMASDGQVTLGHTVMKGKAKKTRKIYNGKILAGFAGAAADAFSLLDKFEAKLKDYGGDLKRASVELAKDWRSDKILRKLEAMLLVADLDDIFLISGNGDIISPDEPVVGIGSGGSYAYAAGLALLQNTELTAEQVAVKSLEIASTICIYTNNNITLESITKE